MSHYPSPENVLPAFPLPFAYNCLISANHERVDWPAGNVAYDIGDSLDQTWVILRGIVSLIRPVEDGRCVEAATIGPGGMIGYLGARRKSGSIFRAETQVAVEAVRVDARLVLAVLKENPGFRNLLCDYREALEDWAAQTLACRSYHRTEKRLARWLHFAQSCTLSNRFDLTHSDLADLLGVSRSVITEAIRRLERMELISSSRSNIHILDRRGLRSAACKCRESHLRKNIILPFQSHDIELRIAAI